MMLDFPELFAPAKTVKDFMFTEHSLLIDLYPETAIRFIAGGLLSATRLPVFLFMRLGCI
jgi:hypothetical protein